MWKIFAVNKLLRFERSLKPAAADILHRVTYKLLDTSCLASLNHKRTARSKMRFLHHQKKSVYFFSFVFAARSAAQ